MKEDYKNIFKCVCFHNNIEIMKYFETVLEMNGRSFYCKKETI